MGKRAKAGACLEALVEMAIPLLQEAERQCPRTGPGAKPEIPDWLIGVLIMVAVLKRKKTKAAQFRFVTDVVNRPRLAAALPHSGRYLNSRFGTNRRTSRGDWRSFEPLIARYLDSALSPNTEAIVAARVVRLSA